MSKILVVCPTFRDYREFERLSAHLPHAIFFHGEDASEHLHDFDPLKYINDVLRNYPSGSLAGIISTDDYPGSLIASILADELGLPGPSPNVMFLCQHKFYCRKIQQRFVPEATPLFGRIRPNSPDLANLPLPFPFFAKPVKSFFSILAGPIYNLEELQQRLNQVKRHATIFIRPFNQLLSRYGKGMEPANGLMIEELLSGQQVTVEGYVFQSQVTLLSIVDAIMYPGTLAFERFDCPSQLEPKVQNRMVDIATRLMTGIGFDNGMFNIEMFYDPESDRIHIIEVNPRICSQFSDLNEKVHGINSYLIQLALAMGTCPHFERWKGAYSIASSFVFRTFTDKRIASLPGPKEQERFYGEFPDARVEIFGKVGARLSAELQDGKSYRYAVINLGAQSPEELQKKIEKARELLPFSFSP